MKFKTIYADPPWEFNDKLDKTRKKPYKTLTVNDLKKIPMYEISEIQSHLYLWCPTTLIDIGLEIMKSWDFDYKTIIVWEKLTKHNKKWFGMGHYFRGTLEICLFGTRGNLKTNTNNTRNSFEAKKPDRHHSAKPDEMYEIIEANSPDPYLELFATKRRNGWFQVGYELDGKDIMDYKYGDKYGM